METLLKVHQTRPIEIQLPGNRTLDLFISGYEKYYSNDAEEEHVVKCYYHNSTKFNYLTDNIIKSYIIRHLKTHLKLFSIDGYVRPIIEIR
jgi:hypothetical protein